MLDAETSPETHRIIGALVEVHKELGAGFLENVYHSALQVEFEARGIPFEHEAPVVVHYKGRPLAKPYRMDFVCYGRILIEVKCQESVGDREAAQVIHYLKASRLPIGLLANFGERTVRIQRFVGESFPAQHDAVSVRPVGSVARVGETGPPATP